MMRICVSIFFLGQLSVVFGQSCQTEDGPACVFPFKFKEITYNSCTKADWNTYWCATSVDSHGTYTTYGNCKNDCPMVVHDPSKECLTTGEFPCVFPFTYAGVEYDKCTTAANNGVKWCPINKYPGSSDAYYFEPCNMKSQCV